MFAQYKLTTSTQLCDCRRCKLPLALQHITAMKKIIIAILIVSLTSCITSPRIGLDSNLWTEKQELRVKGRQGILINQKLSFGDFRTLSIKRSWTRSSTQFGGWAWGRPGYEDYARIIGTEYSDRKQTVRFELTDESANESSVFCVSRAQSENLVIGKNPNSLLNIAMDVLSIEESSENLFWVKIYLKNDEQPWEMVIDNEASQAKAKSYTGAVAQSRDKYYTIHPLYKITDKKGKVYTMPIGSMGYEIRNKEGKPLAAMSTIDRGMVYFNTSDREEKFLLANVCAALLLQEAI